VYGATITDSNISTTATPAAGFDVVTVVDADNDVFDFNAAVVAVQAVPVAAGVALAATGTLVLAQLQTAFLVGDNALADVEAALINFTGGEQFLVVDTDANQTITAADQVIQLLGVTTGIALGAGADAANVVI
jgi:hypothetical protein